MNLGGYKAINTTRILVVDDFDIASIRRSDGNYLLLDINFFDMLGNFVGVIMDNKWTIDTRYFWDVEYKSQHLIVRSKPRKILFDLKIENEEVFLTGNMYYINTPIIMTRDMISIGGIEMARLTIKDARVGINFQNRSR